MLFAQTAALRAARTFRRAPSQLRQSQLSASSVFDSQAHASTNARPHLQRSAFPRSQSMGFAQNETQHTRNMTSESRGRILLSLHDLELALERRGLNAARVLIGGGAVIAAVLGLMWPQIKEWGAVEGAEVAAASLQQEELQRHARALVTELLADPRTGAQVELLLKDAVVGLFKDEEFTQEAVRWTAQVLSDALTWDDIREQGKTYLKSVFQDPGVQETAANGIWSSLRESLRFRRLRAPSETSATSSPLDSSTSQSQQESGVPDDLPHAAEDSKQSKREE